MAGAAGTTFIVNFPGSPKAVRELFAVVAPTLRHVFDTLHGRTGH
jgi:molybdopterin biosynthesis enzyme MoaB